MPKKQTRETSDAELNATGDSSHPFDEWLRVARIDRIGELSDAMTKVREAESTSEEACEEAKDQAEHD